jgi:hypothetical protein
MRTDRRREARQLLSIDERCEAIACVSWVLQEANNTLYRTQTNISHEEINNEGNHADIQEHVTSIPVQ